MQKIFVVIFSLLLCLTSAWCIEVKTPERNQAVLWAPTCQELSGTLQALRDLKQNIDENDCSMQPFASGEGCRVRLNDCLPQKMQNLHGSTSFHLGPNCWNFALYAHDILPVKRHSLPEEMSFYSQSSACHEVNPTQVQPGDIGLLRTQSGAEVHAFIYIDEHIVFAKHAESRQYPYELMSWEKMNRTYERTRACRASNRFDDDCYHRLSYLRCRPLRLAEDEQSLIDQLDLFESEFERLNFDRSLRLTGDDRDGDTEKTQAVSKHLDLLTLQIEAFQSAKEGVSLTDETRQAVEIRLRSLRKQTYEHQVAYRHFRKLRAIKEKFRNLKNSF